MCVCVCGAAWILLDSCLELGEETEAWWVISGCLRSAVFEVDEQGGPSLLLIRPAFIATAITSISLCSFLC